MSEQPSGNVPAEPGTAAGCIDFLDKAGEKGWFNVSSARSLRIAFGKVMSIDDGWEQQDLRTLDVDEQFSRFQTLKRNEYSDGSLRVYRSRFQQAVKSYLARLNDDPNWKSYGPAARSGSTGKNGKKATSANAASAPPPTPAVTPDVAAETASLPPPPEADRPVAAEPARRIDHRFPLRDDFDAVVTLPRNLTAEEAEWLASFIRTLARPSSPAVS